MLLTNGDFFGYKLLIENRPSDVDFIATRKTFCVKLSKKVVQEYIIDKVLPKSIIAITQYSQ